MKNRLAIIIACIVFVTSLTCVSAISNDIITQQGFVIGINGEPTDYTSVINNDTHYVPLRMVFEKMGASVFYRSSDRQVLALSRDGDIIRHIVGDNKITVNDEQKEFENPSVLENNETYISIEM